MIPDKLANRIATHVQKIYRKNYSEGHVNEIYKIVAENLSVKDGKETLWSENDIILITYGDTIITPGEKPLGTLLTFLKSYLGDTIPTVHILPFFPFSSDDGFSVIDFLKVNPDLGDWSDIRAIAGEYGLMADLVINHVSRQHRWFENYLMDKIPGRNFFIALDPVVDLSAVTRPRSSPLLTPFTKEGHTLYLWTTFSEDQLDLNFRNPAVLIEMIRILVFYLKQGIRIIRLDAIAFLWKQPGSACLHLPETHEIVKLIRTIGESVNPEFILLTETNVPNCENLSYLGKGDEAHMVYQFSLPPLVLYTLFSGNAEYLVNWLDSLPEPPEKCTFLNFTASHDGIGVRPLEGLLPVDEITRMIEFIRQWGGKISYKRNPDGRESAYEMNITYFDAMKGTAAGMDDKQVDRFICSQLIMLALKGVPAFYIHSLLATANDYEGMLKTGRARTINRKRFSYAEIKSLLSKDTVCNAVFRDLRKIINIRREHSAFHPDSFQKMLNFDRHFICFRRISPVTGEKIVCISNISAQTRELNPDEIPGGKTCHTDLTGGIKTKDVNGGMIFKPYQTAWLLEE